MTKEEYAKSQIDSDYDEYEYLVVSTYNVDDIDVEIIEEAIKDSIYNGYLTHLHQDDEDTWLIEDYQVLESDIMYEIRKRLKLD